MVYGCTQVALGAKFLALVGPPYLLIFFISHINPLVASTTTTSSMASPSSTLAHLPVSHFVRQPTAR